MVVQEVKLGPGEKMMLRRDEQDREKAEKVRREKEREKEKEKGKASDGKGPSCAKMNDSNRYVGWADQANNNNDKEKNEKGGSGILTEEEQVLEGWFSYKPPPEGMPRGVLGGIDLEI